MGFSKLHLSPPLTRVLERQGYTSPTPIQEKAIPVVLSGKDVMGLAQTGTGKTAAFALPILERLMKSLPDKTQRGHRHARVLVLAPTRELATQIGESFATYGVETGLSHTTIFGGVSQFHQVRAIQHGVDIIIATPGRLIDLMEQRLVTLQHIEFFILDEADRMLDMGFIAPIRRIASALPAKRQTLMFSATMDKEVNKLAQTLLREPTLVEVPRQGVASEQVEQLLYFVQTHEKQALLTHLLKQPDFTRVVVFTKTKHGAERVGKKLIRSGISAETIHGNKAQNARTRALDRFRSGRSPVLVATDVAARGLDVDDISHVINMDLPMEPDAYVHRIGRTGRAGATGKSISFCDQNERGLLRDVERLLKKNIPTAPLPDFPKIIEEVVNYDDRDEDQGRGRGGRDGRGSRGGDRMSSTRAPKGPPREKPGARGVAGLRRPPADYPEVLRDVQRVSAERGDAPPLVGKPVEGKPASRGFEQPGVEKAGFAQPGYTSRAVERQPRGEGGRDGGDGRGRGGMVARGPAARGGDGRSGESRSSDARAARDQSRGGNFSFRDGAFRDGVNRDGPARGGREGEPREGGRAGGFTSSYANKPARAPNAPRFDDRGQPPRQGGGVRKLSGPGGEPGGQRSGKPSSRSGGRPGGRPGGKPSGRPGGKPGGKR